jgi:hypothetical protein
MILKTFSMENFIIQEQWENQERDRKTCEDAGNLEMKETSRRQRRMEALLRTKRRYINNIFYTNYILYLLIIFDNVFFSVMSQ